MASSPSISGEKKESKDLKESLTAVTLDNLDNIVKMDGAPFKDSLAFLIKPEKNMILNIVISKGRQVYATLVLAGVKDITENRIQ